jgi:glucokinase
VDGPHLSCHRVPTAIVVESPAANDSFGGLGSSYSSTCADHRRIAVCVKRVNTRTRGSGSERCILGVDVGATNIRAGIVTLPGGSVHAQKAALTEARRGRRLSLNILNRVIDDTVAEGLALHLQPTAVGIGLPELVGNTGTIDSHCTLAWRTEDLRALSFVHGPITIASDVRAAALAEARLGAGRGVSCFLFVIVGTGISSTLVVDGIPYIGAHGHAISFASGPTHPMQVAEQITYTALETLASGPAVLREAQRNGASETSTIAVCRRARAQVGPQRDAVDVAAAALAVHVGVLANALDPALIVLGGGLGSAPGRFWTIFRQKLRHHLWGPDREADRTSGRQASSCCNRPTSRSKAMR